jgi:hypothetical protein
MKPILAAFVTILSALLCGPARADLVVSHFPSFAGIACDSSELTCNGSAAIANTSDGTVLRLTPAQFNESGSAFSTSQINLGSGNSFSTFFQFRITNPAGIDPADGITFTLQTVSNTAGGIGGGIGYSGLSPSVAVEFDTFNNGGCDASSSNHVAVDIDGNTCTTNNGDLAVVDGNPICDFSSVNTYTRSGCMSNGDLWSAWIDYNGSALSVALVDGGVNGTLQRPATNIINAFPIDIASILGQNSAFVGFTSGTGAGTENHDVVNWIFSNTFQPINPGGSSGGSGGTAPEPGTSALLLAAAVGLLAVRRRSRRAAR